MIIRSLLVIALLIPGMAFAQDYFGDVAIDAEDVVLGAAHYSPFLDQSYPNQVFWGDTHLNAEGHQAVGRAIGRWQDLLGRCASTQCMFERRLKH